MPKILIVEDDKDCASRLELFCKGLDYKVLSIVDNFEDAIHIVHIKRPDLILSEVVLGGKNIGLDIALKAQEKYGVATLFITSYYNKEILKQAKKINFYGYVMKPYKKIELEATMRLALCQVDKNRAVKKRYVDINGYTFDIKSLKLNDEEKEVGLSDKSQKLLLYLSKYLGEVRSYEEIIDYVYDGEDVSLDTLRHLLKRTRDVVKKDSIESIRGIGYRLKDRVD